jgi:hypothetical protein
VILPLLTSTRQRRNDKRIVDMTRATFAIAVAFLYGTAAAQPQPPVTFDSPCECQGNHGKGRLTVKNDPSTPPTDASGISGRDSLRRFRLAGAGRASDVAIGAHRYRKQVVPPTGRVVAVQIGADGDLHIELGDATNPKPGLVVCEIPADPTWCEIRKTIFSWTPTRFPLHIRSTRKLTLNEAPTVTVVGKAFWDIGRARKDQSNRRKRLPQYAVWEIHPVMALQINQ